MGDANSIAGQLLVTPSLVHSSRSVQCNQTVQFTKTAFTHFSLFFGGPSLSTRDQDRGRDFMGDANSIVGQQLHCSYPSLVHSSRFVRHSMSVQFPKQLSHTSLYFLVDQVLASQIKTEEETLWVMPTPLWVSSQSHHLLYMVQDPISPTRQSSFQNSSQKLLFVFRWTKFQHHRSRLGKRLDQWGRFHFRSAISHPYFVNSSRSFQRSKKVHISTSSLSFLFAFWWIVYCFMLQPQVQTTSQRTITSITQEGNYKKWLITIKN